MQTYASASVLNQNEGMCVPDTQTINECVDPMTQSDNTHLKKQPDQTSKKDGKTEKSTSLKTAPLPRGMEHHSPDRADNSKEPAVVRPDPVSYEFVVYFFWGSGCPHCKDEKVFLNEMKKKYLSMKVNDYEVWYDEENAELFAKMAQAYNIKTAGVPVTFVGNSSVIGFSEHSKKELLELFQECAAAQCIDPADLIAGKVTAVPDPAVGTKGDDLECTEKARTVYIPWIGKLDSSEMSLPVVTLVIAGLDSFNPCAFFVLFSLLGLLIHAKSRKKMFLIGSVFIFFSGFIYFLFMAAWLNLFLVMGQVNIITILAGLVAVVIAAINIKDFFIFKKGVSLTIPDSAKPKLFDRMRKLLKSTSIVSILIGTAVLAIAANAYELLCTAGFPMVYTRILTLNDLSTSLYYFYLIFYNAVYIIPLALIVIMFTLTLGKKQLTEYQGRLMKLMSGFLMLALGCVLLFKPEALSNAFLSFILLAGALIISLAVAVITRSIKRS